MNNCFFLPKRIYVTQDKYNDREQALMKVSLQQGMASTVEATTQALLQNDMEPEQTKLIGASIDSKISKLTEDSKRHLQSFENKLEESTNKRLKRIEDLIASMATKTLDSTSKNKKGATHGALPKKSRGTENHQIQTTNRSWNRGGQVSGRGRGRGRGRNQTAARAVTFNMSRIQATNTLNHYPPQQQRDRTNQDIITVDNEPDSSADGWGRHRNTSNNVPPSNLNDGSGR